METEAANVRLPALVGVIAVAIVVAVIWAATPLAASGSSDSSNSVTTEDPAAAFVQDTGRGSGAEDCPDREEEGEDSSANL
jgi:ABC-type transporter Mla subunit MlaD